MELTIHAKEIQLDSYTEGYIRKKLARLERHLRSLSDVKLEVAKTSARASADQYVAQLTLVTNGRLLRGQERGASLFEAIDSLADVMDRQIGRYKTKYYRTSRARRSARAGERRLAQAGAGQEVGVEGEGASEGLGEVVRTKRFAMSPMTVEEAIREMELLSHDFFLFYNADTSQFNVVYRRRSGDYGLIEPELV